MLTRIAYQALLRDPRWQRRRLEILARDRWTCQGCGATDQELHVHHTWYVDGAPWEAPDAALVTLCWLCHRTLSMPPTLPTIVHKERFTALYAQVPTARSDAGHWYFARDPLVYQVADKHRKPREIVLSDYFVMRGGHSFRQALTLQMAPQGIAVEWEDSEGTFWWIAHIAVHFVAQYDHDLETRIYDGYVKNGLSHTEALPQKGDPLSLIIALAEHTRTIEHKVERHDQDIAELRKQLPAATDRHILRAFVYKHLPFEASERQLMEWGGELSRQMRRAGRGHLLVRIWDDGANREVNEYPDEDMDRYFRNKGLIA